MNLKKHWWDRGNFLPFLKKNETLQIKGGKKTEINNQIKEMPTKPEYNFIKVYVYLKKKEKEKIEDVVWGSFFLHKQH